MRAAGSITEMDASEALIASRARGSEALPVTLPRRFQADLAQGALCGSITMGSREKANTGRLCGPLPIRGDGSFDLLYVGPRVRVSQNVEGGGVRTVHVRVTNFGGFR